MPSIKHDSTVEQLARVFCGEGKRNKAETLRIMGYAESTAVSGMNREKIYENARVKAAIARVDARKAVRADVTEDEIVQRLRLLAGLDAGLDGIKPTRAEQIRSLELLGKTKAMFTDNINDNREGLVINVQSEDTAPHLHKDTA